MIRKKLAQTFDGVPSDSVKVTINVKDEASGEIFHTATYPDQRNNL
jgi:hypothetical protein